MTEGSTLEQEVRDITCETVRLLLQEDRVDLVDQLIGGFLTDLENRPVSVLLTMLTATLPAKDRLPRRAKLFSQVDAMVQRSNKVGEEQRRALANLK